MNDTIRPAKRPPFRIGAPLAFALLVGAACWLYGLAGLLR